jgi:myosin heavy subunit
LFNWDYVRPQLECGGIIDALRILKCGFPTRCTYEKIFSRYGKILQPTPPHLNKRDFCEAILRCAGETLDRQEFQLGLTKVFFRPGKQAFLESLLEEGAELPPETIKAIKRFLRNKRFFRVRGAIR